MGDHILAQTLSNTVSDVTLGETVLAHPVKSGDNPLARKTCFLEVTESGSTENSADVKVPVRMRTRDILKSDAYKGYIDVSLEARQAALASMIAGI